MKKIAILGASGFVGTELTLKLLDLGHEIKILSRHPQQWPIEHHHLQKIKGDVKDKSVLKDLIKDVDILFYLVHGLAEDDADFEYEEARAALNVLNVVQDAKIEKIIYLGGLGPENPKSQHLRSRHLVGEILGAGKVPCLEFRASIVVGAGSLSFEMMKALIHRLPVRPYAPWLETLCQPIGIDDLLKYLIAGLETKVIHHQVVEIGGQQVLTYGELLDLFIKIEHLQRPKLLISKIDSKVVIKFLDVVVPEFSKIGKKLFSSLIHPTVITTSKVSDLYGEILPEPLETSFKKAIEKSQTHYPPLWGSDFWKEMLDHYQLNPEMGKDFLKRSLKKFDIWEKIKSVKGKK